MIKYRITFTSINDVKKEHTCEKEKEMLNFIRMAFGIGIKSIKVEQFKVTEK